MGTDEQNVYYNPEKGKLYHYNSHCSSIDAPLKLLIKVKAEAEAAGRTACPVCAQS